MVARVAIFPASGGLGTATLSPLIDLIGPSQVTLISRHPENHATHASRGAVTRQADFDDTPSFFRDGGVFEGCTTLNLISYPSIQDDHRFEVAKRAIDAAIAQGVSHIFYSSLAFGGDTTSSVTQVMAAHLRTESYLAELADSNPKITYTIIRQGLYSTSYPIYTGFFNINQPGDEIIRIPHDGFGPGLSWAKREELGEATANIIASYVRDPSSFEYTNKRIILSGPKSYSLRETAEVFSKILGKEIRIKEVTIDEYATSSTAQAGFPAGGEDWPRLWATAWEGIRRGEAEVVTGDLEKWLGRKPEEFEVTIRGLVKS